MKTVFIFIIFLAGEAIAGTSGYANEFKRFEESFKKLDVTKIPLSDLRNFENVHPPMLPIVLPSPFQKNSSAMIQIWAHGCAPCLAKLKNSWHKPNQVWVNIDKESREIAKSLDWLESNKILITAYHDFSQNIKNQIGEDYPIPMAVSVKNLKVTSIEIGGPAF